MLQELLAKAERDLGRICVPLAATKLKVKPLLAE
jgi:hypothetical protein